jgi:hypothetical protein
MMKLKAAEHEEHLTHVLHQCKTGKLYAWLIFFMLITMGVLAFYAIQQVAQTGWSRFCLE